MREVVAARWAAWGATRAAARHKPAGGGAWTLRAVCQPSHRPGVCGLVGVRVVWQVLLLFSGDGKSCSVGVE